MGETMVASPASGLGDVFPPASAGVDAAAGAAGAGATRMGGRACVPPAGTIGSVAVLHSPLGPRFTRSFTSPFSSSNSVRPFLVIRSMTALISLRSMGGGESGERGRVLRRIGELVKGFIL